MITNSIATSRTTHLGGPLKSRDDIIHNIIGSRRIFNVQTVEFDLAAVYSIDIDPSMNFVLLALSNGSVELQGIEDHHFGKIDILDELRISPFNLHRVQWNPGAEQFFCTLDNHNLYLVQPHFGMRIIETYNFNIKTAWCDWNPNDNKMIAVCGSESQTRLVDIRSGSSAQTLILAAKSGLASHRATRCIWSTNDVNCLFVGDNEGYIHVYDTRNSRNPYALSGEEAGQISGMSFTTDNNSVITCQGTENKLVRWHFDKCNLKADLNHFKKRPKEVVNVEEDESNSGSKSRKSSNKGVQSKSRKSLPTRRARVPLPADMYLRSQLYVTNRHVFCPTPQSSKKSKELYIYDIESGYRMSTLKSDAILSQGVYAVAGLIPDSLALFVGGKGRLRVWAIDEDFQRKMDERMREYHRSRWDSDED